MSTVRQTMFSFMWLSSWGISLYLFATGAFWGGMGCVFIALFSIFFQVLGLEAGKRINIEDIRSKAKQKAYDDELARIRNSA